ncbi:biotin-(acetyl-CoA-carboxylase) ligase [beta proteobacterium KB13]|uniref:biotin--[biotin carboxyl-carrier protein] ligase n=1 Tax=beta proteobacterium KB13 TaxID=314607 RepID=B6BUI5_9PROT|nr:biotin-(acetyl-CoA-carboxylase) ligase [beta proteobacterium KB13]
MAADMGCSRVTVWKSVSELKSLGINIFSVKKKGYRLPKKISFFNIENIQRELGELNQFVNLELLNVIDSTNKYLNTSANIKPHASVVIANIQTKGKGRRGRSWQASVGESLSMSILWKFDKGASGLSGLSLVVGVAIQRLMKKIGINNSFLKWPNDLLILEGDAYFKLAGVLIELQGDLESRCSAVIGVGLNYDLSSDILKNIDQPATNIKKYLNSDMDLNQLSAMLIKEIINALSEFENNGFLSVKEEWLSYNAFKEKTISFTKSGGEIITGQIVDIENDGALKILQNNGIHETLISGEVSQQKTN